MNKYRNGGTARIGDRVETEHGQEKVSGRVETIDPSADCWELCVKLDGNGLLPLFIAADIRHCKLLEASKEIQPSFPACASYDELAAELTKLPMSWYPALIRVMIISAYSKNVFVKLGASKLVARIEKELFK